MSRSFWPSIENAMFTLQPPVGYSDYVHSCYTYITLSPNILTCWYTYAGQLGHGTRNPQSTPKMAALPPGGVPVSVCCSTDCSILVTSSGGVLATGNNLHNKLALNKPPPPPPPPSLDQPGAAEEDTSPQGARTTDQGGGVGPEQSDEKPPAILGVMKGLTPGHMGSSFMSSTNTRRALGRNKEILPPRPTPKGAVNVSMVFQPVVAMDSWYVTSATTGTNHTAFLTGMRGVFLC